MHFSIPLSVNTLCPQYIKCCAMWNTPNVSFMNSYNYILYIFTLLVREKGKQAFANDAEITFNVRPLRHSGALG